MNRYNLKKQIYPLFAILSFVIILPIGMVFSSNSWMWLFVLAYWLLFLAFGYWRACLSCLTGMAFLIIIVSGVTVLMTKDWKACELSALRCAMISIATIPLMGMSYTKLGKSLDTLRAPKSMSLAIMILFAFIPILMTERSRIMKAYKVRGGNPHVPFAFFKNMIVPFLVRTISISDTLALSVETRGFDLKSKPKEIYEPVIPKLYDWIYITSLILVSGAIIGVGIWLKAL